MYLIGDELQTKVSAGATEVRISIELRVHPRHHAVLSGDLDICLPCANGLVFN
jgi:hypothetical protein